MEQDRPTLYRVDYEIPANSSIIKDITGNAIKHIRGTGDLKISIDHAAEVEFSRGIGYPAKGGNFTHITLVNPNAFQVTGVIFYGTGDIVNDSFTITDAIEVVNKAGDSLTVDNADITSAKNKLTDIHYLLRENVQTDNYYVAKSPKTPLLNASFAQVSNTTTTIVSAAANTDGVFIRHVWMDSSAGTDTQLYLKVNGNDLMQGRDDSTLVMASLRDIYVPAGQAITAQTNHAYNRISVWYEVL